MIEFIEQNKEVLALCVSALGIFMSFTFSGFLSWRHRICIDYESKRDVAINILRDSFVQRASEHYSDVANERKQRKTAVEEIYKRPEQSTLIRQLGIDLEKQNRVRRLFRWLMRSSNIGFYLLWTAIVTIAAGIGLLWLAPPFAIWITWGIILAVLLISIVLLVSAMCSLDSRFIQLVNDVIEPEGE